MKRRKRRLWIALLLIVVLVTAMGVYVMDYSRASDVAMAALEGSDGLRVKSVDGTICVETTGSTDAMVFYPGGKIQAEAYMTLLRRIARRGIDCYLVKMPFNLALFGVGRVADVMRDHPTGVGSWRAIPWEVSWRPSGRRHTRANWSAWRCWLPTPRRSCPTISG